MKTTRYNYNYKKKMITSQKKINMDCELQYYTITKLLKFKVKLKVKRNQKKKRRKAYRLCWKTFYRLIDTGNFLVDERLIDCAVHNIALYGKW